MPMPDYSRIPPETMASLMRWISNATPIGSFVSAVVSNDLREAFGRADEGNRAAMFEIVSWLYNNAPMECWGSPACLDTWKGLKASPPGSLSGAMCEVHP